MSQLDRSGPIRFFAISILATMAGAFSLRAAVAPKSDPGGLGSQIAIERRLLSNDLDAMTRIANSVGRASDRVSRLAGDLRDSLRDEHADPFALGEKEGNLREAEATLRAYQDEFRDVRLRIVERRQRIALIQEELQKRREQAQKGGDAVTGLWEVVTYPGPSKGTFDLALDGTLISGEYSFDGNWRGSLKGNMAGDRIRLERWDAELGFTSVFYGRLSISDKSMKGTWEATDLAAGKPTSGTWVAHRKEKED